MVRHMVRSRRFNRFCLCKVWCLHKIFLDHICTVRISWVSTVWSCYVWWSHIGWWNDCSWGSHQWSRLNNWTGNSMIHGMCIVWRCVWCYVGCWKNGTMYGSDSDNNKNLNYKRKLLTTLYQNEFPSFRCENQSVYLTMHWEIIFKNLFLFWFLGWVEDNDKNDNYCFDHRRFYTKRYRMLSCVLNFNFFFL